METPLRELLPVPWFGAVTSDHDDPLNRSIRVRFAVPCELLLPTAQDSPADTKLVPERKPPLAVAPDPRLSEPHVEAAARLTPAPSSADGTTASAPSVATSPIADPPLPITIAPLPPVGLPATPEQNDYPILPTNRTRGTPCGMSKVIPIIMTPVAGAWMTVAGPPEPPVPCRCSTRPGCWPALPSTPLSAGGRCPPGAAVPSWTDAIDLLAVSP